MMSKWGSVFIFALMTTSSSAWASFFELRATGGLLYARPDVKDLYGSYTETTTLPTLIPTQAIGADLLIMLPFLPGIGARYESMGMSIKEGKYEFAASHSRTAVLMNYRLIDTIIFLGPIASYGVGHSTSVKIKEPTKETEWVSGTVMSSQVGLEFGIKLFGFMLGAEGGYEVYKWKDAGDPSGTVTTKKDIDMSGGYAKILLGISI